MVLPLKSYLFARLSFCKLLFFLSALWDLFQQTFVMCKLFSDLLVNDFIFFTLKFYEIKIFVLISDHKSVKDGFETVPFLADLH